MRCLSVLTMLALCSSMPVGVAQDARTVWNAPQEPFGIYGNVYYVGPRGLSVILITSSEGHVLIDGALPESAPGIVAGVRALGFRVEDIRLLLNSHAHFDHAGGMGTLQRLSGARVAASPWSARVMEQGRSDAGDPQYGAVPPIDPLTQIQVVADRETVRVGPLALTAHSTPGHTPGGTTWSWQSCQAGRCLDFVYADSLTAVAADGFRFTASRDYPDAVQDFERSFARLSSMPCDVLLTPHPEASDLWNRLRPGSDGGSPGLVDDSACRRYAEAARVRLRARIETETKQP